MSNPYREARRDLKAQVIARVTAGTSLNALGREAELPSSATFQNWARTDPCFRFDLDDALRRGTWRRRWAFDPVRGEALLARYRDGETIAQILRDPKMPSHRVLAYWRATDPAFNEALFHAQAGRVSQRQCRWRAARPPRAFDPKAAERVLIALVRGARLKDMPRCDPSLPGRSLIARWRREEPEFDAEVRAALRHGWARDGTAARRCARLTETIVRAIVDGASLHSLSRRPGMPCSATLYRWVRERPAFAREVAAACHERERGYLEQIEEIADTVTPANRPQVTQAMAALNWQLGRLKHRPGQRR